VSWYQAGEPSTEEAVALGKLLDYASAGYSRHTDWFVRHRDIGLQQLAGLLAAELLLLRFFQDVQPRQLSGVALILLGLLSLLLGQSSAASCSRAFRASLEHAVLISKIVWALTNGATCKVALSPDSANTPVPSDRTLFVPRYLRDAQQFPTTEEYVAYHMGLAGPSAKQVRNTHFWARVALWSFALAAFSTGVVSGAVILLSVHAA
jgi:hypothetical protein